MTDREQAVAVSVATEMAKQGANLLAHDCPMGAALAFEDAAQYARRAVALRESAGATSGTNGDSA